MPEPTRFLPAETASPAEIERQRAMLAASPIVADTLDGMLNFAMVVNRQRQAVFVNRAFRTFLAEHGVDSPVTKRIGDLAGCVHSEETPGGCGTTESCRRCGAAKALQRALGGEEAVEECRILSRKVGEDLDLRVSTRPFNYNGEEFLLICLVDISSEKRREVLERLFFHDILNTAGGVQGLIGLMLDSDAAEIKNYVAPASRASDRLIDQILTQKDLAAAERGDLHPKSEAVPVREFLAEIAALFAAHEVGKGKTVAVSPGCADIAISTDKTLLSRVIGNLTKNALEAVPHGAAVTLDCRAADGGGAVFTVHNPGQMPEDSRLQVFQRSFSTKGPGRGLGTYSIRLLTERYLKGKVTFTTGPEGTTFTGTYPASL